MQETLNKLLNGIYHLAQENKIELDKHYSDLYIKKNEYIDNLIKECNISLHGLLSTFKSELDNCIWYEFSLLLLGQEKMFDKFIKEK